MVVQRNKPPLHNHPDVGVSCFTVGAATSAGPQPLILCITAGLLLQYCNTDSYAQTYPGNDGVAKCLFFGLCCGCHIIWLPGCAAGCAHLACHNHCRSMILPPVQPPTCLMGIQQQLRWAARAEKAAFLHTHHNARVHSGNCCMKTHLVAARIAAATRGSP